MAGSPTPRPPTSDARQADREAMTAATPTEGGMDRGEEPLRPGASPLPGYRLIARLGRGGFGEVWKAEAPGGVPVALKFVRLLDGPGHRRAPGPGDHQGHPPSQPARPVRGLAGRRTPGDRDGAGRRDAHGSLPPGAGRGPGRHPRRGADRVPRRGGQGDRLPQRATSTPSTAASGWACSTATSSRRTSSWSAAA